MAAGIMHINSVQRTDSMITVRLTSGTLRRQVQSSLDKIKKSSYVIPLTEAFHIYFSINYSIYTEIIVCTSIGAKG